MAKYSKYNFFSFLILLIISFYILVKDVNLLGFFADDISIIVGLSELNYLQDIIYFNETFDAGRDLQPFWMKIYTTLSVLKSLDTIHYFQVFLYFTNSIVFIYILKLIQIEQINIVFAFLFFLFFPLNSEIIFWTHNLPMTLTSTTFFLIFLAINIKIFLVKFEKNLTLDFLCIILVLLSIFTYEQGLFSCFLIIILRTILSYKYRTFNYNLIIFFIYSFITIYFSFYKINQMKDMELGGVVLDYENIFQNFLSSIKSPITVNFSNNIGNLNLLICANIFIILLCIFFLYLLKKKKINSNNKLSEDKNILLIFIFCILLYFCSFITLYFHHISPRHFYLPSIFISISLSIFLNFCLIKNKKVHLFFSGMLLIIIVNNISNVVFLKNSQIENFRMKEVFYKKLITLIDENDEIIKIKNFPDYHNKAIFFAHEQSRTIQFILNDIHLPLVSKNLKEEGIIVKFIDVKNSQIEYEIISN